MTQKCRKSSSVHGDDAAIFAASPDFLPLDQIICGDNCEIMRRMPSESIDLVVTSPPYDDLRTYGGHSWDFYGVAWNLKRLLKPGGVIVWVVNDETKDGDETGTSFRQALHFKDVGLRLHDTMIWDKGCFTGVGSVRVRYGPSTEYMLVFSNGKPKAFNPIKDRRNIHAGTVGKADTVRLPSGEMLRKTHEGRRMSDYGIRFNVWKVSPEMSNANRFHPGQFPEPLAKDHILSWSNPGDVVLDPFSGSGTTAKMARETGRRFIGIEVNPEYVEISRKRLAQQALPMDVA
jgi:site-specific DNA-methyltransferase (adenine-specific)